MSILNVLKNKKSESYKEFYEIVDDLLSLKEVKELENYPQHVGTSRFTHSMYVAYCSYKWAKFLNLDYKSAARGGLLHDLFHYNWSEDKQVEGYHAKAHPIIALRTAKELVVLNKVECDAIEKHMWPVTVKPPRYLESYIVTFADKYCATIEIFLGLNLLKSKETVLAGEEQF